MANVRAISGFVADTINVVIPSGEALSSGVFIGGARHLGVTLPTTWATAKLTFQVSSDGTTWCDLVNAADGTAYTVTIADSQAVPLDAAIFAPWQFLRIRSGTKAVPVMQEGTAAAQALADLGGDRTLTVTSGVKGAPSNNLSLGLDNAAGDALAVTGTGNVISVALASTTSTKNSAAAIQTAIRALSTVSGIDVTAATVEESIAYAAARPKQESAAITVSDLVSRTLTIDCGLPGEAGNSIMLDFVTAADDNLAVLNPAGTNSILIKMATTTAAKNTAAAITTALQALATVGPEDLDVSAMTATGNEAYDASPPAGGKASKAFELDTGKTLTATSGVVGAAPNAIKFYFNTNTTDDLAVTIEGTDTISILLASTTANKNAAATIQTAVRALTTVAGVAVGAMTIAGNTAYNSAPVTTLGAGIIIDGVPLENGHDTVPNNLIRGVSLVGGAEPVTPFLVSFGGGEDATLALCAKE